MNYSSSSHSLAIFCGASQGLVVSVGLLQMLLPQIQQPLHLRTLRTVFASMSQDSRGPGDADEVLRHQMGPEKAGTIWENPDFRVRQ
jgi:hypothetical protein